MSWENPARAEDGLRLERLVSAVLHELGFDVLAGDEKLINTIEYSKARFRGVDFIVGGRLEIECKNMDPKNQYGKSFFITRNRLPFSDKAKHRILIIPAGAIKPKFLPELKKRNIEVIDSIHKLGAGDPEYDYIKDNIKRHLTIIKKRLKNRNPQSILIQY